jgi:hypothetical protein
MRSPPCRISRREDIARGVGRDAHRDRRARDAHDRLILIRQTVRRCSTRLGRPSGCWRQGYRPSTARASRRSPRRARPACASACVCPHRQRSSTPSVRWSCGPTERISGGHTSVEAMPRSYEVTPKVLGWRRATRLKPVRPQVDRRKESQPAAVRDTNRRVGRQPIAGPQLLTEPLEQQHSSVGTPADWLARSERCFDSGIVQFRA